MPVDDWDEDDAIKGDEPIGASEPYDGPETVTINAKAALRLFTDWHQDDDVSRRQARDYAHRLLTRLLNEARG